MCVHASIKSTRVRIEFNRVEQSVSAASMLAACLFAVKHAVAASVGSHCVLDGVTATKRSWAKPDNVKHAMIAP